MAKQSLFLKFNLSHPNLLLEDGDGQAPYLKVSHNNFHTLFSPLGLESVNDT